MPRALNVEAARRAFLADGASLVPGNVVRAEVLASWERSRRHRVDPDQITARFAGHDHGSPVLAAAEDAFDDFFKLAANLAASLVLVDPSGTVRVRRDGDEALARLLDEVLLVPGYGHGESVVGTTAASVALHERGDFVLRGAEHYHSRLMFISGAASLVPDSHRLEIGRRGAGDLPRVGRNDVPAGGGADAGPADRREDGRRIAPLVPGDT